MSCWVCRDEPVFTDEHNLDWCAEHVRIWREAVDATGDDPSF